MVSRLPSLENGTNLGGDRGCMAGPFCGDGDEVMGVSYGSNPYGDDNENVDVLAQELNMISIKEREAVYDEIHGVAGSSAENPDNLEEITVNLEKEIQKIKNKSAYDRALFLSPRYVNDPAFRLMFLRSTRFDPVKAAAKMVAFFECKLELFGMEKLVKRITLQDLDEDDLAELTSGSFQFLPFRDQSNRALCMVTPSRALYKTWQSTMRAVYYAIMTQLENEDSQLHGFVNIWYCLDTGSSKNQRDFFAIGSKLRLVDEETLPYRNVAVHYCYNSPVIRPAIRLLALVASKQTRLRFRTHYGSAVECRYALSAFGIPTNLLPIDSHGIFTNQYMDNFLRERMRIEEGYRRECEGRIDYPSMCDIVLGRGKPYQEFPGNLLFNQIIDKRRDVYHSVDRFQKTCISIEVAKQLEEAGMRFLTRDKETGGWVKAADNVVREKICGGFRIKKRHDVSPGLAPIIPDHDILSMMGNDSTGTDTSASMPPADQPSNDEEPYSNARRVFEDLFDFEGHRNKRQKQETLHLE